MAEDRVQRKLAAILAADVVSYSRLMGDDEEGTLATLKDCRDIIDPLIAAHGGRIFGGAGDSLIAEFASPVEAVNCATKIQLAIEDNCGDSSDDSRMRFRIGINLGDVIIDGDDLMGDGVNVAARLEAIAPPGGVCISESVRDQVRDRLGLELLDMGEHIVKNIARPLRAYKVQLTSEVKIASPYRGLETFEFEHASFFSGARRRSQRVETGWRNGRNRGRRFS
jgi:class 3 adenylate cyclase